MVPFVLIVFYHPHPPVKKQDDQAVKSLGIMSPEYSSCPVLLPAHVMQEGGAVAPWEPFPTMPGCLKGIYAKYQEARPLGQGTPSHPLRVLNGDSWQGALRTAE